jgi:alpha-L-fucosidase
VINLKRALQEPSTHLWWQKPGFGIMYQIEARPGWIWERDFDKFNASIKNNQGKLDFNGPFCKMQEWVNFSKNVSVDYHIFEAKWHDGICYFDTAYTNWKTPIDYCQIFAEESKKQKIPFMFYYSNVFDHNPQFDDIQPVRSITSSFIALHREKKEEVVDFCLMFTKFIINQFIESLKKRKSKQITNNSTQTDTLNINDANDFLNQKVDSLKKKQSSFTYNPEKYEDYVRNQLSELIKKYEPNGMWMDWFMKDSYGEGSSTVAMNLMKEKYPSIVLAFNNSINERPDWAHYLSGEAHTIDSAWEQANKYRHKKQFWELVGPAAKSWFDPSPRSDPLELARIAVIIIASGGRFCFGIPSQIDGSLYPEPAQHLKNFGNWYKFRRVLFSEAVPIEYKKMKVPGVEIANENYRIIGSIYKEDRLLHLINFTGEKTSTFLNLSLGVWDNIKKITIEPEGVELKFEKNSKGIQFSISETCIDPVDTILRIHL